MKLIVSVLLFFICVELATAQTPTIDSIDRLINKTSSDTARINLVIQKLNLLGRINLDSAISLGESALKETQQIKYYKGEIAIRLTLSKAYANKGDFATATANLKYLEHLIKSSSKDSADFAGFYAASGMLYGIQTRYDSAIYFYEKAIGINERLGNIKPLALNYSNIANSYMQQSNFPLALYYQQKALKIAGEQNDETSMAYAYIGLGITYGYMGDSVRAEQNYLKAVELAKKKELPGVELFGYSNLSNLYTDEKNWQKTYDFAMKAAKLAEAMGDQGSEAASLSKAAIALANTNKFDSALIIARRSLVIADSSEQPLNIFQVYVAIGTVYKLQGNCTEAINNFEKGIRSLESTDIYTSSNAELYKDLSECYEKTGNTTKALQYYKIYAEITDSVRAKDNVQKATELTLNYEFNKKQEAAAMEQERKNAVADAKQLALLIGLGLTLVLAIVAMIALRNKVRTNFLLKKQKEEIQSTLTQLRSTQAQLIHAEKMASLGELTAGIAHEIQNPLNFVNNFSEVNKELIDELKGERQKTESERNKDLENDILNDIDRNLEKISFHGKRADAIVKGMLQHSRSSTGQREFININRLADEYLRLSYHGLRAKDKSFNTEIKTDFDESIGKINILPQDIGRVLLNLFTNAFYAVNEKKKIAGSQYQPSVSVQTKKIAPLQGMGAKIEIVIKDNGTGVPQHVLDKIFQPFFTTKPPGEGTGLGLSLAYDIIVKEHNGNIKVESKEGEGAEFIIQLPAT